MVGSLARLPGVTPDLWLVPPECIMNNLPLGVNRTWMLSPNTPAVYTFGTASAW